ncbi:MAG: UDP-3-O-(3-hydroxymyristoyl)glucosamine N-acyltransferase [Gammaproteobacteria bacterium]|nr:UDP-3-O-(3-hydroxymyristoyl)glucosamine N-acyltransferase [Gammaproteobacteria bacterium]
MSVTLAELAARFGCELRGNGDTLVDTVGTLESAAGRAISFLANPRYRAALRRTRAAAVILKPGLEADCPVAALLASNPYATYARIARFLHPAPGHEPGIHPTAIIDDDARVAATAQIGANVMIGSRTRIGDGVSIGPGVVVGENVSIGAGSRVHARVVIMDDTQIGERCVLHPGVVLGADGFGFAPEEAGWVAVPQLGKVVIGDDVSIGANSAVDRGAIDDTVIESAVIIDNLVQIGHNVHIGAQTAVAGFAGVAGSARIGRRCLIGAAVLINGHISICDDVFVTMHSTVLRSIDEPGKYSSSFDTDKAEHWGRNAARFRRLNEQLRRREKE